MKTVRRDVILFKTKAISQSATGQISLKSLTQKKKLKNKNLRFEFIRFPLSCSWMWSFDWILFFFDLKILSFFWGFFCKCMQPWCNQLLGNFHASTHGHIWVFIGLPGFFSKVFVWFRTLLPRENKKYGYAILIRHQFIRFLCPLATMKIFSRKITRFKIKKKEKVYKILLPYTISTEPADNSILNQINHFLFFFFFPTVFCFTFIVYSVPLQSSILLIPVISWCCFFSLYCLNDFLLNLTFFSTSLFFKKITSN